MKRFLTIALCALFACQAGARTLYVNAKRPNNNGNGLSAKKAKKTIQSAINASRVGDTILVYPGTYAPIKTRNKRIRIVSVAGRSKTVIAKPKTIGASMALASLGKPYTVYLPSGGTGKSGIFTKGNNSVLEGFLLDGKNRFVGSGGDLVGVSGGTLRSCMIRRLGNKFQGTDGGFPSFEGSAVVANARLLDCIVRNNSVRTLSKSEDGGGSASLFQRCAIFYNDCGGGFGAGTSLYNCRVTKNTVSGALFDKNTAINCTIVDNVANTDRWGDGDTFSSRSKFRNCILYDNCTVRAKKTKVVHGYFYYNPDGDCIGYREKNASRFTVYIEGDEIVVTESSLSGYCPGFTKSVDSTVDWKLGTTKRIHNVDAGNTYRKTDKTNREPGLTSACKLKNGSYCVDSGHLTKAQRKIVGSKDIAGRSRIRGKAIDRGCYEL